MSFRLFMGSFGNGVIVCNAAVMERGDYKQIAHISDAGNITWYVAPSSIPGDALLRIEHDADARRANFSADYDREAQQEPGRLYERVLKRMTAAELVSYLSGPKYRIPEALEKLKSFYLSRN